ncbi:MAG: tyrosine transporter, partial [Chlamydiia bacterium]|nr:tyrosine transporter [Chlamydiia bacterium]
GESGLGRAFAEGMPATEFLRQAIGSSLVSTIAEYFAFFALVTSFLGMTLGLFDFLSDGLGIKERGWGIIALGLIIIVPTYYFAVNYARVFIVAMSTSGSYGDAILNGIMPVMMVWIGRYSRKLGGVPLVPGGRPVLIAIVLFYLASLGLELGEQLGLLDFQSRILTLD